MSDTQSIHSESSIYDEYIELVENNNIDFCESLDNYIDKNNIDNLDFNLFNEYVIDYYGFNAKINNTYISPPFFRNLLKTNTNPTILALIIVLMNSVPRLYIDKLEFVFDTELKYVNNISKQNEKIVDNIDNINVEESKKYMDLLNDFNSLKNKHKDIKDDYIKIQNNNKPVDIESDEKFLNLKEDYDNLMYEKEHKQDSNDEKDDIIKKLQNTIEELNNKLNSKNKVKPLPTLSNSNENKKTEDTKNKNNVLQNQDDKNDILKRIPIIIYSDTNDECCKYAAGEFSNKIKYSYNLNNMINDKQSTINKVSDYLYKNEHKLNNSKLYKNRKTKWTIETKIKRCYYLYNKYNDKLNNIKFSLSEICKIGDEKWKLWLEELDKILNPEKHVLQNQERKLKINNFDNKKFKRFMLLAYILKNKELIKKKLNKEIKLENKLENKEDKNINRFLPYGTEYKGYHGQRKTSKGPCENVDCPNEKRLVYNRLCKKCYNFCNGKYNPNNNFNDEYIGEEKEKNDEMVKQHNINNNPVQICKYESCKKIIPKKYEFCIHHNKE